MAVFIGYPILTLELADSWDFATGLEQIQINVLAITDTLEHEELARYESGRRWNRYTWKFEVECVPVQNFKSDDYPTTGDIRIFMQKMAQNKAMRVVSVTGLDRWKTVGGDPAMLSLLIGRHVQLEGAPSKSMNKEEGWQEVSFTLVSRFPETP